MSKKEKRLESKKKKAIALLNLIETRVLEENKMDGLENKRARWSNDECNANNTNCKNLTSTAVTSIVRKTEVEQPGSEVSDEEYARARKVQRELQKSADGGSGKQAWQQNPSKYGPKINLCLENMLPFSNLKDISKGKLEDRLPPLFIIDLQHLLLLALLKNFSFWTPRWCRLSRPRKLSSVVLVVLQDVSIRDFEEHPDCFPFLKNSFLTGVEMVNPVQYNSCVEQEICQVPLLISQLKCYTNREDVRQKIVKLISKSSVKRPGSPTNLTEEAETVSTETKENECSKEDKRPSSACDDDNFPRTSLLLSSVQLMEEGYPLPVESKNKRYRDYAFSKDSYTRVTPSSPMYAVDCEMCETNQKDFELTRVSVVNEENEVVYDQLVKPYNEITNYLTRYSGMTAEKLSAVTKRVEDVNRDLRELLPTDAILCGQSLWNDLNALKMFHPYVVDTSIIFNQSGDRKVRCGLRKLAFNFLGRKIQGSQHGHCSIEDAKATMDLVKLKLSKDIEFGDALLGGVYFPNIKTYFENPSKAQNVEETFSSHPDSKPDVCDHSSPSSSSSCVPTKHLSTSASAQNSSHMCSHSVRAESDCRVTHRSNGTVQSAESNSEKVEEDKHKAACDGQRGDGVRDHVREGRAQLKDRCQFDEGSVEQKEGVSQRQAFFQQEGSTVMVSFFELLADNGNTAGVIGSKDLLSRITPHPKMDCMEVNSDGEACTTASRVSQHTDLTLVELRSLVEVSSGDSGGCEVTGSAERRKSLLTQLDGHIEQLVTELQTQSLVAVVMTGRSQGRQHLNAATFLKMT